MKSRLPVRSSEHGFHRREMEYAKPEHLTRRFRSLVFRGIFLLVFLQVAIFVYHLIWRHAPHPGGDLTGEDAQVYGSVLGVVSDTGSWNTLRPVLLVAVQEGKRVEVHMSGACARQYRAGKLSMPDPRLVLVLQPPLPDQNQDYPTNTQGIQELKEANVQDLEEFIRRRHRVSVVGASTSQEGIAGSTLALCTSGASKGVVLVEDRYASALPALKKLPASCPERANLPTLCVADKIAENLIASHTEFRGRVIVTGAPMFDNEVQMQNAEHLSGPSWRAADSSSPASSSSRRARVRRVLGMGEHDMVVVIAGQSQGMAQVVQLVLDSIPLLPEELARVVRIVLRFHPRCPAEEVAEVEALTARLAGPGLVYTNLTALALFATSDSLVPGADIVVSGYSTTNYYAILWKVPGVVYAATPILRSNFIKNKKLDMVPEVKEGAAWSVATAESMKDVFINVHYYMEKHTVSPELESIFEAQERLTQYHDGYAAKRVWGIIQAS